MAETCPRRGFRDIKLRKSGAVVTGGESAVKGATILRCSGSHTLPGTKTTENVSGVVLKSLCPRSQNSEWEVYYIICVQPRDGRGLPLYRSVVTTFFSGKPSRIALRISVPTDQ